MEFTLGFITLLVSIVVPGLLFQRFYYYGEFSKQFSTKENVYKSVFYSIVPGFFIQIFGAWLYLFFRGVAKTNSEIIIIFNNILNGNFVLGSNTIDFINNKLQLYLLHTLNIYILSILIGVAFSRIIRLLEWDRKYKLLRFKNQWYYIFSGEVLTMNKFKLAPKIIGKLYGVDDITTSSTYADILIDTNVGSQKLYSGYVVDYDLDSENISNLEKIYLLDAHRYKHHEVRGMNIKVEKVKIPGDVFVILAKNILNINLTYVPSLAKKKNVLRKNHKKNLFYLRVNTFGLIGQIILFGIIFFKNISSLESIFQLNRFMMKMESYNFGLRLLLFIIISQFVYIFLPKKEEGRLYYSKRTIYANIIILMLINVSST